MQRLRFLSRLAFIGHLAFVASLGLQFTRPLPQSAFQSALVVLGYALGPLLFSPLAVGAYAWYRWKGLPTGVPRWLVWANLLFFILELLFFALFF